MTENLLQKLFRLATLVTGKIPDEQIERNIATNDEERYFDGDASLQNSYEQITELQRVWREWVFGQKSCQEAQRKVSSIGFQIHDLIWQKDEYIAKRMMARYQENLPFVLAMLESIKELEKNNDLEDCTENRLSLFLENTPSELKDAGGNIPRNMSLIPDNLQFGYEGEERWNSIHPHI